MTSTSHSGLFLPPTSSWRPMVISRSRSARRMQRRRRRLRTHSPSAWPPRVVTRARIPWHRPRRGYSPRAWNQHHRRRRPSRTTPNTNRRHRMTHYRPNSDRVFVRRDGTLQPRLESAPPPPPPPSSALVVVLSLRLRVSLKVACCSSTGFPPRDESPNQSRPCQFRCLPAVPAATAHSWSRSLQRR